MSYFPPLDPPPPPQPSPASCLCPWVTWIQHALPTPGGARGRGGCHGDRTDGCGAQRGVACRVILNLIYEECTWRWWSVHINLGSKDKETTGRSSVHRIRFVWGSELPSKAPAPPAPSPSFPAFLLSPCLWPMLPSPALPWSHRKCHWLGKPLCPGYPVFQGFTGCIHHILVSFFMALTILTLL